MSKKSRARRDALAVASPKLHRPSAPRGPGRRLSVWTELDAPVRLTELEDGRLWSPQSSVFDYPSPRTLPWGAPARAVVGRSAPRQAPGSFPPLVSPVVAFQNPRQVVECVRRKVRREVLHALGVGGRRVRPGRRGPFSGISCKG